MSIGEREAEGVRGTRIVGSTHSACGTAVPARAGVRHESRWRGGGALSLQTAGGGAMLRSGLFPPAHMDDSNQIEVPPSFLALFTSPGGHRLLHPMNTVRERYELCE